MAFQNVHNPIQAPDKYVEKYDFIDQKMRRVHAGMADILDEAVGNITKMFKEKGYVLSAAWRQETTDSDHLCHPLPPPPPWTAGWQPLDDNGRDLILLWLPFFFVGRRASFDNILHP